MSGSRKASRGERRQQELEDRRARRRAGRQTGQRRSPLVVLSIAALVLGAIAVAGFALLNSPPGAVDLRDPVAPTDTRLADGQALGEPDAALTIEIFSDFQCPACGALASQVKPQLVRDYVSTGDVRLVYRDFAFLGPESIDAAVAGRCAADQDRFWLYHDYLFANQLGENRGAFSRARLDAIAEAAGLEMQAFAACYADPSQRQAVQQARQEAAAVPISSTPTLVLNGDQQIVGVPSYADLRAAIEAVLGSGESNQP